MDKDRKVCLERIKFYITYIDSIVVPVNQFPNDKLKLLTDELEYLDLDMVSEEGKAVFNEL